jgi:hypothetical protein
MFPAAATATAGSQTPATAAAGPKYALDFLEPPGSYHVQLESIVRESIARFKMEAKLQSTKLGISGLSDLYRVTVGLHDDLENRLENPDDQVGLYARSLPNSTTLSWGQKDAFLRLLQLSHCCTPLTRARDSNFASVRRSRQASI